MAIPISIRDLLRARRVESTRVEYKANWNPEKVLHSICAFANDIDNTGGGYVVLGVAEEKGRPILPPCGLKKESVDEINRALVGLCKLLEPVYLPIVESGVYEGVDLLVLWIPGGNERPYKAPVVVAKNARSEKACYIRKMACTLRATATEENTGIPTIVGAMRENGSPDPIFLTDDDRSYFTVVLPAHAVAKAGNDPKTGGDNRGDNRGDNLLDGLPVEQRKICEILLADDHVSIRKIAELLGIRKNTVDKQLMALKNKGMVQREGGTRGVWRVRCKEA